MNPVYTQRQGSTGSYPALRFVMVRFGQSVGIGDTLQQALDQVFEGNSGATTEEGGSAEGPRRPARRTTRPRPRRSTRPAAFEAADKALTAGDLATYQTKIKEAEGAVKRALRALGG